MGRASMLKARTNMMLMRMLMMMRKVVMMVVVTVAKGRFECWLSGIPTNGLQ